MKCRIFFYFEFGQMYSVSIQKYTDLGKFYFFCVGPYKNKNIFLTLVLRVVRGIMLPIEQYQYYNFRFKTKQK